MEKNKDVDFERRKEALLKKFASFVHPEVSGQGKIFIKSNGYYHQVDLEYDEDECCFKPGEILVDQYGELSLCVGIGRSPVAIEGRVIWFLFEQGEPAFISRYVPPSIRRKFAAVAS